ncbi:MAG: lipoate--protein ligase [Treponema sp.]|nr:lipoate--protein ligase [Treponema sp.]
MNYYIENRSTDPFYNLSLEQIIFDTFDKNHSYFMLWQNHNSIIVGKHQNTMSEINSAFVKTHNINVARRLSGGGAVYHDMGNLNFTFITDADENTSIDFSTFCKPIQDALVSFGVPVEITGRNDMTIEGKKISGNAQYVKKGRVMHHGTLLYDSDLEILSKALNVSDNKIDTIESKGIKSVKSRVTNIRSFMKNDKTLNEFWAVLKNYFFGSFDMKDYIISGDEENEVQKLKEKVYSQWSWNYGASPSYNMRKIRKVETCGTIEILLDIGKEGIINNITFYGDFFGNYDTQELVNILTGHHYEYNEITDLIKEIDISRYFFNLDKKTFLSILFY